jgi:hypothetical protein
VTPAGASPRARLAVLWFEEGYDIRNIVSFHRLARQIVYRPASSSFEVVTGLLSAISRRNLLHSARVRDSWRRGGLTTWLLSEGPTDLDI